MKIMTSGSKIDAAHKSYWQISEVIFGAPFLVAVAIQFLVRLSLPDRIPRLILIFVGMALMIAGAALISLARREFFKYSQPTEPSRPTTEIVTTGVFSISRNPIYLGAGCLLAGLGLTLNWMWVLVFLLPSLIACHYVLIAPEEKYLVAKFGKEYHMYATRVHRWIGRSQSPHEL